MRDSSTLKAARHASHHKKKADGPSRQVTRRAIGDVRVRSRRGQSRPSLTRARLGTLGLVDDNSNISGPSRDGVPPDFGQHLLQHVLGEELIRSIVAPRHHSVKSSGSRGSMGTT